MNHALWLGKPQKKVPFLMAGPLREGGGGLKGCTIKEKELFFNVREKFLWPLSRGGEGAKGLSDRATKKRTFFFAASLSLSSHIFVDNLEYLHSLYIYI